MLLLAFRAGGNRYAIDAAHVAEVIPRVGLRAVPRAPDYLAGLLDYRGRVVPVVDFAVLAGAPACRESLSTRVILAGFVAHDGRSQLVGVVAEDVCHVINVEPGAVTPAMALDEAPYLGAVLRVDEGLIQLVVADKLMPGRMQDALYGSPPEPA